MGLKKISQSEAIEKAAAGAEVYILRRITDKTTIGELSNALAFAEAVEASKAEPEPEPEEVAEQAEAPASKSRKPRSPVDHQKIVALRVSGWSVKKISEEMDISEQTVRNHLKEEDL